MSFNYERAYAVKSGICSLPLCTGALTHCRGVKKELCSHFLWVIVYRIGQFIIWV